MIILIHDHFELQLRDQNQKHTRKTADIHAEDLLEQFEADYKVFFLIFINNMSCSKFLINHQPIFSAKNKNLKLLIATAHSNQTVQNHQIFL